MDSWDYRTLVGMVKELTETSKLILKEMETLNEKIKKR